VSKAIREAEKRARERQLQRERKPFEELRMAAKVKPTPIKGSSNPNQKEYKFGATRRGNYTLMGITYEFEEQDIAYIAPSKDQPGKYEVASGTRRWEWEEGKPETKRQVPTTFIVAVIPKDVLLKLVKELE